MVKERTSFTLSPEVRRLLRELSARNGVSQASVIEIAVREYARSQNVPVREREAHNG